MLEAVEVEGKKIELAIDSITMDCNLQSCIVSLFIYLVNPFIIPLKQRNLVAFIKEIGSGEASTTC